MNSPAIRFAGFTEDWEGRSIDECFTERNERSEFGDLISVTMNFGVIKAEHLRRHDTSSDDKSNYKKVEVGDIAYNSMRMWQGASGHSQYSGILSPAYTVITPQEGTHSPFFAYLFKRPSMIQLFQINSQGLTSDTWNLKWPKLRSISVIVPEFKEQQHLSELFATIDSFITLHQCKHDKTVNIKKALLEKMFPKDGEDNPEIRFAGFSDDWERRRVGEFYFFKNGLNKSKEYFGKGTPIINFTDVFHNRGLKAKQLQGKVLLDDNEIKNFEVRQGDIFFTRTSETIDEIGYPSVMLDTPESTVFSGFVLRGRAIEDDPMTNIFKRYVFFTQTFRSEMIKKSSMTTRALTSGTAIKEMCFNFPVSKKEQEQIGLFFANFDRLIALHQRELTKLQNIKKALLEKMFA